MHHALAPQAAMNCAIWLASARARCDAGGRGDAESGWLRGPGVAAGPLLADGPIVLIAVTVFSDLPPAVVPRSRWLVAYSCSTSR